MAYNVASSIDTIGLKQYLETLPKYTHLKEILTKEGLKFYLTGGSVRDWLITGKCESDLDFLIECEEERFKQIEKCFYNSMPVSIRGDSSHKLDLIQSTDAKKYITQADFTINILLYEPIENELIDLQNGLKDIQDKKIKYFSKLYYITSPKAFFRAFRLSAKLGFELDEALVETTKKYSPLINISDANLLSKIVGEFFNFLSLVNINKYFEQMNKLNLIKQLLPELIMLDEAHVESGDITYYENNIQTLKNTQSTLEKLSDTIRTKITTPCKVLDKIPYQGEVRTYAFQVSHLALARFSCLIKDIGRAYVKFEVQELPRFFEETQRIDIYQGQMVFSMVERFGYRKSIALLIEQANLDLIQANSILKNFELEVEDVFREQLDKSLSNSSNKEDYLRVLFLALVLADGKHQGLDAILLARLERLVA